MAFSFRPATREPTNLLIGLAGATGAGKTYTSLLLATGIVSVTGGQIAFIDTERGRALQYAPDGTGYAGFKFMHAPLEPPHSPDRYKEILDDAEKLVGPTGVVIVDSMSHEHEGEGGLLDMHETNLARMAGNDYTKRDRMSFAAWAKPKQARTTLINRVIAARCHLILNFRAKEKSKLVKNKAGKTEIVPVGWQPITGQEWPFEMTIMALLDDQDKGRAVIDDFERGKLPENLRSLFPTNRKLTADDGAALAKWATLAAANGRANPPTNGTSDVLHSMRTGQELPPHDADGVIIEDGPPSSGDLHPNDILSAKELRDALKACDSMDRLSELDLNLQRIIGSFSENTQVALRGHLKDATERLFK